MPRVVGIILDLDDTFFLTMRSKDSETSTQLAGSVAVSQQYLRLKRFEIRQTFT